MVNIIKVGIYAVYRMGLPTIYINIKKVPYAFDESLVELFESINKVRMIK